jgi:hypothetical protein
LGIVGWHGRIVGKACEDDVPGNLVLGYAAAMDEDGENVWALVLDAVERDPRFANAF